MINVLFFAHTRELVGASSLALEGEFSSVEAIRQHLIARGERWALALEQGKLLTAVNQTLATFDSAVCPGDEVAFFPPVTGG